MRHINLIITVILTLLFESCDTMQTISSYVDYGISQWEQVAPADSYDHTLIDAWKSGTGGKSLAISEIAVSALGDLTNKDVSRIKERIHQASKNLVSDENFNNNDVSNFFGAMFTMSDQLIDEYNSQKFEEAVDRLTNPNNPAYNEEEAIQVEIDYVNRKINRKPFSAFSEELIEIRKKRNTKWISERVEDACGISIDEYNNLTNEERQQADLKILMYDEKNSNQNNQPQPEPSELTERPINIDFGSIIEDIVISDYDLNSADLSVKQKETLNKIAEILKDNQNLTIEIEGHTCSLGTERDNSIVGLRRAAKAKEYICQTGIDEDRIKIISFGFEFPIADNNSEYGRRTNRRITFKVLNTNPMP